MLFLKIVGIIIGVCAAYAFLFALMGANKPIEEIVKCQIKRTR